MPKITKPEADWKQQLTPEQYRITREKGTERAFTGEYHDCHADGVYRCVCCGADLFDSDTKFDSGTGWPSFYQPLKKENVAEEDDRKFSCIAPRCCARSAARTWAMSFRTARSRRGCATASTPRR